MKETLRYMVSGIQTAHPHAFTREDLDKAIDINLKLAEGVMLSQNTMGFPLKLLVFPELTVHGLGYEDPKEFYDRNLAVTIPGPETDKFVELAKKWDIYICGGSWVERDPRYAGHLFNTAWIVGPEGLVLKYRKINPWECGEYMSTSPMCIDGYDFESDPAFPVAKTAIGNLGVAICYDWIFPEVGRELTMKGAEVLIRTSAYMYPWGSDAPTNWWTVVSQVRSLENVAYGVHVNQGADFQQWYPYSFPGGTCVVDYEGRLLTQVQRSGFHTALAPIDIESLRVWRANVIEHCMPGQIRSEAYTYLSKQWLPRCDLKKSDTATLEKSLARIEVGRNRVWADSDKYRWRK